MGGPAKPPPPPASCVSCLPARLWSRLYGLVSAGAGRDRDIRDVVPVADMDCHSRVYIVGVKICASPYRAQHNETGLLVSRVESRVSRWRWRLAWALATAGVLPV